MLRNLWITQRYQQLSVRLSGVLDRANVNWSTFACWASKTAGESIRNEELPRLFERELKLDQKSLGEIQGAVGKLLESLALGRFIRGAALDCLRDVSQQVAVGNRKVYAELAPLFARFVDLLEADPGELSVEKFVSSLRPGPPDADGQDALAAAFRAWFKVSRSDDDKERAELMLYANCMIGLHEQTRLQPHIQGAMDAPIELLFRDRLARALPAFIGKPLAFLLSPLLGRFKKRLLAVWLRVATRYTMNLSLPGGTEIPLGDDLPNRPDVYPSLLRDLRIPDVIALVARFDGGLTGTQGTGASNWADLRDRMGFIVALFRSRQQEAALFGPPFTHDQEARLAAGLLPSGEL